jgi:hypothetical protein
MTSSTITISGWTSLGAVAALIECRSTCGLWLIDAASQPNVSVVTGDMFLSGGDIQLFQPAATIWAIPGAGASSAVAGVSPQNIASGGGSGSNASVGSTGAAAPTSATAIGFQNAAGNLVLPTPSAGLPVADSGAAITGASIPAGGVGLTGWLSAIWSKLSGALSITGSVTANIGTAGGLALDTTSQSILAALQAQRAETIWTDDSNAFFVRVDNGGTISWLTISGGASSAPGTGARPAAGASIVLDATRYQATATAAGYATGDYLSHVVTADPSTGAVIANFWLNVTQNTKLSSAPSSSNITPISPLPAGAATAALQSAMTTALGSPAQETGGNLASIAANVSTAANQLTGNTTLSSILTKATAIAASVAGTLTTALAAGSNIIGYAGALNFQTMPVVPAIGTSYAANKCLGSSTGTAGQSAIFTLNNLFRNTTQPSATLTQIMLCWAAGETPSVQVYIFSRLPTYSTLTDGSTPIWDIRDLKYLVAPPITLTAQAPAGSTASYASSSQTISAQNLDSTVSRNLYVVLVAATSIASSTNGDLSFSVSGVLD